MRKDVVRWAILDLQEQSTKAAVDWKASTRRVDDNQLSKEAEKKAEAGNKMFPKDVNK